MSHDYMGYDETAEEVRREMAEERPRHNEVPEHLKLKKKVIRASFKESDPSMVGSDGKTQTHLIMNAYEGSSALLKRNPDLRYLPRYSLPKWEGEGEGESESETSRTGSSRAHLLQMREKEAANRQTRTRLRDAMKTRVTKASKEPKAGPASRERTDPFAPPKVKFDADALEQNGGPSLPEVDTDLSPPKARVSLRQAMGKGREKKKRGTEEREGLKHALSPLPTEGGSAVDPSAKLGIGKWDIDDALLYKPIPMDTYDFPGDMPNNLGGMLDALAMGKVSVSWTLGILESWALQLGVCANDLLPAVNRARQLWLENVQAGDSAAILPPEMFSLDEELAETTGTRADMGKNTEYKRKGIGGENPVSFDGHKLKLMQRQYEALQGAAEGGASGMGGGGGGG
ncbi:MAG TPA: hypothetical protein RMG48_08465, partial [Myxococcales bacterium LLY-WYZ-16_1]|nr:hypothetical protein [Myxococcales bacterium LLY-WYZ-16_1]